MKHIKSARLRMSGANEPGGPADTNEWDSAMAAIRKSRPYLGDAYRAYTPPREGGPTKQEDKISLRQDTGYGETTARLERDEEFLHRYQENLLDRFKLYSTFHCHSSAEQDFYLSLATYIFAGAVGSYAFWSLLEAVLK